MLAKKCLYSLKLQVTIGAPSCDYVSIAMLKIPNAGTLDLLYLWAPRLVYAFKLGLGENYEEVCT